MYFRYISAKIQPKNLKQHFDWEGGRAPSEKNTVSWTACYCVYTLRF